MLRDDIVKDDSGANAVAAKVMDVLQDYQIATNKLQTQCQLVPK